MKYLALTLLLSALLSRCDAWCLPKPFKLDEGETRCQDEMDKTWHAVGSSWRNSECKHCTCDGCCIEYSIPIHFPADCVKVFDWTACQYRVHKKNDPTERCPIYSERMY